MTGKRIDTKITGGLNLVNNTPDDDAINVVINEATEQYINRLYEYSIRVGAGLPLTD